MNKSINYSWKRTNLKVLLWVTLSLKRFSTNVVTFMYEFSLILESLYKTIYSISQSNKLPNDTKYYCGFKFVTKFNPNWSVKRNERVTHAGVGRPFVSLTLLVKRVGDKPGALLTFFSIMMQGEMWVLCVLFIGFFVAIYIWIERQSVGRWRVSSRLALLFHPMLQLKKY